jgi:uncharacterized membrane protein YphA (DoxX/SURF4 family)
LVKECWKPSRARRQKCCTCFVNQSSHFWKNVSMMGGTVLLFITGAGRYALDALLQRKP